MKQTEIDYDLGWLEPEWIPTKVIHHTNHQQEWKEFDDQWAKSMGYKDYADMISHSNKKHQHHKLTYGAAYTREEI